MQGEESVNIVWSTCSLDADKPSARSPGSEHDTHQQERRKFLPLKLQNCHSPPALHLSVSAPLFWTLYAPLEPSRTQTRGQHPSWERPSRDSSSSGRSLSGTESKPFYSLFKSNEKNWTLSNSITAWPHSAQLNLHLSFRIWESLNPNEKGNMHTSADFPFRFDPKVC